MPDTDPNDRCRNCRYWFERCCHALAQLGRDDETPAKCHHFTSEATRLFRIEEHAPC